MNQEQTRNQILSMIENIEPSCVSNCTIDLLNCLNLAYLIGPNIVRQYQANWSKHSTQDFIEFWRKLIEGTAFECPLNEAPGRLEAVHIAIMQCQLFVLLAHRAVCVQEAHKLLPI